VRLATLIEPFRRPEAARPADYCASAARSHVGTRRRVNEDRLFECDELRFWAVADGMGGHAAGDVAAQATVDALGHAASLAVTITDAAVHRALQDANGRIRAAAAGRGSGATVVAMIVDNGWATLFWAGDSRGYRWRGGELRQLTRDHSLVQTLVDQGAVRPEDAERHPHANVVTRALGVEGPVAIDTCESEVLAGDLFLLCSDGLSKAVPAAELSRILAQRRPLGAIADELVEQALARDGSDNITLVVVRAG
jgi:serine/threonine protein phosphatase PrpC